MEFKEIQVEILRGSCNFPSGNIYLSDGSLEKVWQSVVCQPDFPEFFTRNIRESGGDERLARVYAVLRVDARDTGDPVVSISFYRYKSLFPGYICRYEYCAFPRDGIQKLSGGTLRKNAGIRLPCHERRKVLHVGSDSAFSACQICCCPAFRAQSDNILVVCAFHNGIFYGNVFIATGDLSWRA
ncbi:hypothetical protein NXY29_00795 [Bacteroides fragilis]|nr:hypothetical protein [Bacteroides fragilis]